MARLDEWSGNLRDPHSLLHILWTIFFENDGVGILYKSAPPRGGLPVADETLLDNVFFTHDRIRGRFGNGDHRGSSVNGLIDDLVAGRVDPMTDDRLILEVVRYNSSFRSLNNRRLYAMKESQRIRGISGIRVRVRIWPLDPVTIKFVLANTTRDAGRTVEVQS